MLLGALSTHYRTALFQAANVCVLIPWNGFNFHVGAILVEAGFDEAALSQPSIPQPSPLPPRFLSLPPSPQPSRPCTCPACNPVHPGRHPMHPGRHPARIHAHGARRRRLLAACWPGHRSTTRGAQAARPRAAAADDVPHAQRAVARAHALAVAGGGCAARSLPGHTQLRALRASRGTLRPQAPGCRAGLALLTRALRHCLPRTNTS